MFWGGHFWAVSGHGNSVYNVGNLFFVLIRDQTENKNLLMCTNLPLYELGCINATVASWQQRGVLKIVYATMNFLLT